MSVLTFQPWTSSVEVSFWYQFTKKKLDLFKLSEAPVPVVAYYSTGYIQSLNPQFFLNHSAFDDEEFRVSGSHFTAPGTLNNKNKIEDFKGADKKQLLAETAAIIWEDITSGRAVKNPTLLNRFSILTFSDLKKYHFYYWFLFPALTCGDASFSMVKASVPLKSIWDAKNVSSLDSQVDSMKDSNTPYFIARIIDGQVETAPLSTYEKWKEQPAGGETFFAVMDPGNTGGEPGWPARNLLCLLNVVWGVTECNLLMIKYHRGDANGDTDAYVLTVDVADFSKYKTEGKVPPAVGLEKNHQGKLQPKFLNLAGTMDAKQLMENAVDLNLKLMRWRMLPNLNLELVAKTKCLLLGAGTLGCNLARSLMSWGVRTITFVDSGKVSFSNPVRQTLYTFEDAKSGSMKAPTAAAACKAIFPSLNSTGHVLTIPMPGHPVQTKDEEEAKQVFEKLRDLIAEHDVIFLGVDSREARWLPTLLGAIERKLVMNVALGFDTYVVMRHGVPENDL